MLKLGLLLVAGVAGVQVMSANVETSKPSASYESAIQTWRAQRVERLKAPNGWLSLIGLEWLKEGKNTIGSDKKNDIVLAAGPAHLGVVTLAKGKATIALDASGVSADIASKACCSQADSGTSASTQPSSAVSITTSPGTSASTGSSVSPSTAPALAWPAWNSVR